MFKKNLVKKSLGAYKYHMKYGIERDYWHRRYTEYFIRSFFDYGIKYDIGPKREIYKDFRSYVIAGLHYVVKNILGELKEGRKNRMKKIDEMELQCKLIGIRFVQKRVRNLIEGGDKERATHTMSDLAK